MPIERFLYDLQVHEVPFDIKHVTLYNQNSIGELKKGIVSRVVTGVVVVPTMTIIPQGAMPPPCSHSFSSTRHLLRQGNFGESKVVRGNPVSESERENVVENIPSRRWLGESWNKNTWNDHLSLSLLEPKSMLELICPMVPCPLQLGSAEDINAQSSE